MWLKDILFELWLFIKDIITIKPVAPMPQIPLPPDRPAALLATAKSLIGKHLTLNPDVPPEVGCAEAVSAVLKQCGYVLPLKGIEGTNALYDWLNHNPKFQPINSPEMGAVIISPTGYGNGKVRGHTGILGGLGVQFPNDYGILSNDSNTGLFLELWSLEKWKKYYGEYGGIPVHYFRAV